jgi:hypothetical protein
MIRIAAIALALTTAAVHAEPLPVPKPQGPGGSCPFGYTSSGSFCMPSAHAQDAIVKPPNGSCPCGRGDPAPSVAVSSRSMARCTRSTKRTFIRASCCSV